MNTHNLAVMFRTLDPNLGHVSTFDAMEEHKMSFMFGHFMSIPRHHWRKRRALAERIADALESNAKPKGWNRTD